MDGAAACTVVNFNITLACRMIQGQSPLKIRLHRIRQYDTPFGVNILYMKIMFSIIVLYSGFPISRITNYMICALYLIYWFLIIYWWYFFSICNFKRCIHICIVSDSIMAFITGIGLVEWFPMLIWSAYITYISIWYNMSYVKTNFILS